ncbi:head-tail connector protein [Streptomyces sp. NPDC090306]|uniref:head-tail connector protein n=1 Tax=Streptomyces sp. NPDC090306 TaxID=3365961 RepID=UPI003819C133
MGLVSLADAKRQLNIDAANTDDDVELQGYIDAVTAPVEDQVGYAVDQRLVTERVTVRGTSRTLVVPTVPVLAAVSVTSDGGQTWTDGDLAVTDPWAGEIEASGVVFTGRCTVVVRVGLATTPANVRLGALIIVQHLWDTQRGAMGGVQLGSDNEGWNPSYGFAIPRRAQELLGSTMPGVA